MDSSPSILTFNPFRNISVLFQTEASAPSPNPQTSHPRRDLENSAPRDFETERRYFLDAMKKEGVKPFVWHCCRPAITKKQACSSASDEISEVLLHLHHLIEAGEGFHVAKTPEYIEGTGLCVPASYAWRLHRGDFSIQAHIDLHGMNVKEARSAFNAFLKEAVSAGKRAVLSSFTDAAFPRPRKNRIEKWHSDLADSRAWRKWIIAYSSAQSLMAAPGPPMSSSGTTLSPEETENKPHR
jgi:hypothetical protein